MAIKKNCEESHGIQHSGVPVCISNSEKVYDRKLFAEIFASVSPSGRLAKTNDSSTWSDFDTAWRHFQSSPGTSGIGFVFTADVQDCRGSLDELCEQLWPRTHGDTIAQPSDSNSAFDDCLASLLKLKISDHSDGSHRLFVSCCRCVEHDLSDDDAIRCIRQYAGVRPFPKDWTDTKIAKRLRGRLPDINSLRSYFDTFKTGFFKLIIPDAFYRFMPKDTDENSNGNVADLYNTLDR